MSCQRITVTKRGIELQEQLKEATRKEQRNYKNDQIDKDNNNLADLLKKQGKEQLKGYMDILETRLNSPEKIKIFLNQKFNNQPKFIQREVERASQRIHNYGNIQYNTHKSLPSLDFRQIQQLKTKYNDSTWTNQNLSMSGNTFYKSKEEEGKKLNYLIFQEAKIERMITKYEKFNEKAQNIPCFMKGRIRNENFTTQLLKSMESKDTRIESVQELREIYGKDLDSLEFISSRKERLQQTMNDIHNKKYKKYWERLRVGK